LFPAVVKNMDVSADQEMFPVVQVDLMRTALKTFYEVGTYLQSRGKPWSGKARDAVLAAVRKDWRNGHSYVQRCFAFFRMMKTPLPKTLEKWVLPDGSLDDVLIDAIALAPLRRDSKFRIKEFRDIVAKIESDRSSVLQNQNGGF